MSQGWTIKDGQGDVPPCFTGASRLEVERKVVSTHYDAFRLLVSSSYRETFARNLAKVLAHKGWRVVRTKKFAQHKTQDERSARIETQLVFRL